MVSQPSEQQVIFTPPVIGCPERHVKSETIPQAVWQEYYEIIRKKYIDENVTLEELRSFMRKEPYQFNATWKLLKSSRSSPETAINDGRIRGPSTRRPPFVGFAEPDVPEPLAPAQRGPPHQDVPGRGLGSSETSLNQIALSDISFGVNGEWPLSKPTVFIRRTAGVGLFFNKLKSYQIAKSIVCHLHLMTDARSSDSYWIEMPIQSLIHQLQLSISARWHRQLQQLSQRILLLMCNLWDLDSGLWHRGQYFFRLMHRSLCYCGGQTGSKIDPLDVFHAYDTSQRTLMYAIHQNLWQYMNRPGNFNQTANLSEVLLAIPDDEFHHDLRAAQIQYVSVFILPEHVNGLAKILDWCTSMLSAEEYHLTRQQIIAACCLTLEEECLGQDNVLRVERRILFYYLVTSYWCLRSKAESRLNGSKSEVSELLLVFDKFLNDFGISMFDILDQVTNDILQQPDALSNMTGMLLRRPSHSTSKSTEQILRRYQTRHNERCRSQIAEWWLSCWVWEQPDPVAMEAYDETVLTILENHILTLISQNIERTQSFDRANAKSDQDSGKFDKLPTLPEEPEPAHLVLTPEHAARPAEPDLTFPDLSEKQINDPMPEPGRGQTYNQHDQSPTLTQDHRYSTASIELDEFQASGEQRVFGIGLSLDSRDLPSEYVSEVLSADMSLRRFLGLSGSSSGSSGRMSISGASLGNRISATLTFRSNSSRSRSRSSRPMSIENAYDVGSA